MTNTGDPYVGPERRRDERERHLAQSQAAAAVAEAMDEVRQLQDNVTTLAQATSRAIPALVEARTNEIRKLVYQVAVMLVALLLLQLLASNMFVNRLERRQGRIVDVVTCFHQKAAGGDVSDAALLACKER